MQFLFPTFLYALGILAVPIIIHLFYFRRYRKVYFTNVRFLREVKEETSARSKLRNLLVLLMRLMALAFLVLAFARPYLPVSRDIKLGINHVGIFIDNSFSMNALSEDVPLLDKAKQRAREIVDAYSEEDRFQVLTHDLLGRHQRLVSKSTALQFIDDIDVTPAVNNLSIIQNRQLQLFKSSEGANRIFYILSDFQRSITDLPVPPPDSAAEYYFVPFSSVQETNIAIDSCWFEAPTPMLNQSNRLLIKVRNFSSSEVENVRLTIEQDGQIKPLGTFSVPGNAYVIDTAEISLLRGGWYQATISITDYPVQFDDHYFAAFEVADQVSIMIISDGLHDVRLKAAIDGLDFFTGDFQQSGNINYASISDHQLIILNDIVNLSSGLATGLTDFISGGGNVLIIPPANANLASYNSFFQTMGTALLTDFDLTERDVSQINTEEFIFQDVFKTINRNVRLPKTKANFRVTAGRSQERLLTYRDGSPFLSKTRYDDGQLYICYAPLDLDFSDLTTQAEIFIPMLYKMAISTGKRKQIAYTIGTDEIIEIDQNNQDGELVFTVVGREEFIPGLRRTGSRIFLNMHDQISEAGFYQVRLGNDPVAQLAFNHDRKESDLSYFSGADLRDQFGQAYEILDQTARASFTKLINERTQGRQLWRWCIALVLLFLAAEILILRLWKA